MDLDLFLSHPLAYLKLYLASDTYNLEEIARAVGNLIVITWAIHIVDWGFGRGSLSGALGIRPRQVSGLPGIFFAPLLHFVETDKDYPNNSHIVNNTLVFVVLGFFIALQGLKLFYVVTLIIALVAGIGTWLFGSEGVHAGASSITFGYRGFLLIYGLVSRNPLAFLLGILSLLLYGRNLGGGVLQPSGHFFGFFGGVIAGYLISYVTLSA